MSCKLRAVEAFLKDKDRVQVTELVHIQKSEAPRDVRVLATVIPILESD
jgi:hypothetical protein